MIVNDLKDYWTLVSSHQKGDTGALIALELMSFGTDKSAQLAGNYLAQTTNSGNATAI